MFDAYTVKKVMPRLLIAAILIQLSWPLFTGLILVTGQIAWGIEGLLYAPFGGRDALDVGVLIGQASGGAEVTLAGLIGLTAAVGGAVALGAAGLLSLGITVLLALLIAFFVLAVRQVVLVVLLVTAPLALVAWILPNTEKFWKLWWESFSKLLLMYPMILLLIAGGRVAAKIAADVSAESSANDGFGIAIVVIAFFAPFFLIPKTFQLAGSMFANIAGIANDRSRGAFDRLKGFRGQQVSQRHQDRMAGKTGLVGARGGNAYRRVMSGGKDGAWNPTAAGRRRYHEAHNLHTSHTSDKALEEGGAYAFNDDTASRAALWSNNRDEFVRNYARYVNEDRAAQGLAALSEAESLAGAQAALGRVETATGLRMGTGAMKMAAGKFRVASSNTAYESGEAGLDMMREEMASLRSQHLTTEYDQAGWMKSNRGRGEFSAASYMDNVAFLNNDQSSMELLGNAAAGADPREFIGGHQRAVESLMQGAEHNYSQAVANHGEGSAEAQSAAATLEKVKQQLVWSSQRKSDTVVDTFDRQGVLDPQDAPFDTGEIPLRQSLDTHKPITATDDRGRTTVIQDSGDRYKDSLGGRVQGESLDPNDPNHPRYQDPNN